MCAPLASVTAWHHPGMEEMRCRRVWARGRQESNPSSTHTSFHLSHAKMMSEGNWCQRGTHLLLLTLMIPKNTKFNVCKMKCLSQMNSQHFSVEMVCKLFGKPFLYSVILIKNWRLLDSLRFPSYISLLHSFVFLMSAYDVFLFVLFLIFISL